MKYYIFACSIFLFGLLSLPAAATTITTLNISDDSAIRSDKYNQAQAYYLDESVNIYNGGSNDYRYILGAYIPPNYCEISGNGDTGDVISDVKLFLYSWRQSGAGNNVCLWESADKVANTIIPWEEYGGTYFVDWYDTGTTTPAEWDDANGASYRGGSIYDPILGDYDVLDCHSTLADTPDEVWESWTVLNTSEGTSTIWNYEDGGRLTVVLDHWPGNNTSIETGYRTSEYTGDTSKRPYYQITCSAPPETPPAGGTTVLPSESSIILNGDNWYYWTCDQDWFNLSLQMGVQEEASTTIYQSFNCASDEDVVVSGWVLNAFGYWIFDDEVPIPAPEEPGFEFYCIKTEIVIGTTTLTDYDQIGITWLPATSSQCSYDASSTRSILASEFCADPCAAIASTSNDFFYGFNCGVRETVAWFFCVDEITTEYWAYTMNKGAGKFPFSLFSDLNQIIKNEFNQETTSTTIKMWSGHEATFNTAEVGFGWDSVLYYVKLGINIAITVALILIIIFLYVIPPPNREDEG